ncbi:CAP (Cysteine-rich secretory proteins Antigen 5 and Pathogenesis-related 1 protein) superfamily protein [Euphorbia peplus]|nr:CAP (Cysteine-rich secretory proteins Antigen 5 and Pathogenesis-related 1 protein) superfamily protein [Euphorbia peplus]
MTGFVYAILVFSWLALSATATLQPGGHVVQAIKKVKVARLYTEAHNAVRLSVGSSPVIWNRTLARYARRWAAQRVVDCKLTHSDNNPYGENLFWSKKGHWAPKDVVKCWADEGPYYNPVTNECVDDQICGHYTQLIWKNSKQIGCGRSECNDQLGFMYVCEYDPPGNIYNKGPLGGVFTGSIIHPPPDST